VDRAFVRLVIQGRIHTTVDDPSGIGPQNRFKITFDHLACVDEKHCDLLPEPDAAARRPSGGSLRGLVE
jgi:hypothetical protein